MYIKIIDENQFSAQKPVDVIGTRSLYRIRLLQMNNKQILFKPAMTHIKIYS